MAFQNLKIGARLGGGFGVMLVLLLALMAVALTRFSIAQQATTDLIDADWVKAEAAGTVNATTRANARRTMELFFAPDQAARQQLYAHIDANKKTITDALATLERLVRQPEGKALLARVQTERAQYVASFSKVGALIEEGRVDDAKRLVSEETLLALDTLQASVEALADQQARGAQASAEQVKAALAAGSAVLIGLGIGALLVAVACAWLITRSITRPISRAVDIAKTVASGDLTAVIDVASADETGQLLRALKDMNASLLQVVGEVRAGTDTVSTASAQIAAGNLDLSSRTEQQASSLQQTAASMEELTSTVKQNADNALQANALASSASEVAVQGGAVVAQVVQTMHGINASSKRIADIIGVIDGIAFQTNILALNAAVEAARAGEQGRGFAVVATEVRALAQRSAAAAKEIKTLIDESVRKVDGGCKQVEQAGRTMDDIVAGVRRVTDIVSEIAAASHEQTAGIAQINVAIAQMDQVTQQNAALVEESASAAASLEERARGLAQAVGAFRVRGAPMLIGSGGQYIAAAQRKALPA